MIDPINTTAFDGAECVYCGADATGVHQGVPLCDRCASVECFHCTECYPMAVMERPFGSRLYCPTCVSNMTQVIDGREQDARADEQRDDFNERRR